LLVNPRREGVVFETGPICERHALRYRIDILHIGQQDTRVFLPTPDATQRGREAPGRKRTGVDLIRQRLKKVVVVPVDQGYIDGCRLQRLRRARVYDIRVVNGGLLFFGAYF